MPRTLKSLIKLLPSPPHPLFGKRAHPIALPENVACFERHSASDLNRPRRGRALHHRFVLIFALETGASMRIDDQVVSLKEGHGVLVLPFQFHDYSDAQREELKWLFITFDMVDDGSLQGLRHRAFALTPQMLQIAAWLVSSFLKTGSSADEITTLLLALLLSHIRRAAPAAPRKLAVASPTMPGLVKHVNEFLENKTCQPSVKEIANSLGISSSHLRARFRQSCGVSLGKHMRRQRLEKARGLLRLSARRVSEIAEECGFSSVYTFSRAFHSAYGVAPLEYRKGAHINLHAKK